MAKKQTKKSVRNPTDWNLGQPLAFPPKKTRAEFERLAREAVAEGIRGPFKVKQPKRKKK